MLAFIKFTKLPAINARKPTDAATFCLSGQIAVIIPIIIPKDPGLAKPHTAYVAIAELRNWKRNCAPNEYFAYHTG